MDNSNKQPSKVHHKRKHSSHKRWFIISAVIFIIVVSSIGWGLFISSQKSISLPKQDVLHETMNNADNLAGNGDISGAKAAYDEAIAKTTDPIQKSALLIGKAGVFYNEANYDQALNLALEAENLGSNENTAQFIASIYALNGDNKKAIQYYQKAISLIDKTKSSDDSRANYYLVKIDALGGVGN